MLRTVSPVREASCSMVNRSASRVTVQGYRRLDRSQVDHAAGQQLRDATDGDHREEDDGDTGEGVEEVVVAGGHHDARDEGGVEDARKPGDAVLAVPDQLPAAPQRPADVQRGHRGELV